MKSSERGFTLIELLIVVLIISSVMGLMFPLGNHLRRKSLQLSVQADAARYQNAFLDYFEAFDTYPENFPVDVWFDLTQYFSVFVNFFNTKIENRSKFCRLTAQEVQEKSYPHSAKIYFFLCKDKDVSDALETSISKTIFGTGVLYRIDYE